MEGVYGDTPSREEEHKIIEHVSAFCCSHEWTGHWLLVQWYCNSLLMPHINLGSAWLRHQLPCPLLHGCTDRMMLFTAGSNVFFVWDYCTLCPWHKRALVSAKIIHWNISIRISQEYQYGCISSVKTFHWLQFIQTPWKDPGFDWFNRVLTLAHSQPTHKFLLFSVCCVVLFTVIPLISIVYTAFLLSRGFQTVT